MGLVMEAGIWGRHKQRALPTHRNCGLEVVLLDRGHAHWHIEGREVRVAPGAVFFTLPWERHGGWQASQPGLGLTYVVLRASGRRRGASRDLVLPPQTGLRAPVARRLARLLQAASRRSYPCDSATADALRRLVEEGQDTRFLREEVVRSLVQQVLLGLGRLVQAPGPERAPSRAEAAVAALLDRWRAHPAQPWGLPDMAAACGLGTTRFTQIVRQITGDPPVMALNRIRVEAACRLLRTTPRPVTDIAFDCGFSSSQYFAKVFRQYTGRTPRDWRRGGGGGDR